MRRKLIEIRKYIENNFENVGDNFSKKVREIYYDKKNNKTIYGTTTQKEREELSDEGIDLLSIPWVDKEKINFFCYKLYNLLTNYQISSIC